MKKKILLWITAVVVLVAGVAVCLLARWYTHAVYTYERVEHDAAREEIDMDRCIYLESASLYGKIDDSDYCCFKYLCVFDTGDVYCFEIQNPQPIYRSMQSDMEEKLENVIYLGRFSASERRELEGYIDRYDPDAESYWNDDDYDLDANGGESSDGLWKSELKPDTSVVKIMRDRYEPFWDNPTHDGRIIWLTSGAWLYKLDESEDDPQHSRRIYDRVEYDGVFGYITYQNMDENAIAAVKLVRLSDFFDRFATIYLREQ